MRASRAGSRSGRAPGWGKPCSTETPAPHPPGPAPPQSSHAGAAAEHPRRIRNQAPWPGHLQRRIRNPKGEPLCVAASPPSGHQRALSSSPLHAGLASGVGPTRVAWAKPISGCRQLLRYPVYLIVLLRPERATFTPIPGPGGPCLPASLTRRGPGGAGGFLLLLLLGCLWLPGLRLLRRGLGLGLCSLLPLPGFLLCFLPLLSGGCSSF